MIAKEEIFFPRSGIISSAFWGEGARSEIGEAVKKEKDCTTVQPTSDPQTKEPSQKSPPFLLLLATCTRRGGGGKKRHAGMLIAISVVVVVQPHLSPSPI